MPFWFKYSQCDVMSTGLWTQKCSSKQRTLRQPICAPFKRQSVRGSLSLANYKTATTSQSWPPYIQDGLIPRLHFLHPGVWSTAYSIIHLSALEWWCTDLKLGMIEDCIPHCVTLIECLCKVLINFAAQHYLCTWSWYCACFTIQQWWVQQCWSSCHLQESLLWSLMEHYVMKRGNPPPLVSTVEVSYLWISNLQFTKLPR